MSLFKKPKYSTVTVKKKDIPKGLWTKCPKTGEIIYNKELEQNLMVVPQSGYHFPLSARSRIDSLLDTGSFEEKDANKLEQYEKRTGEKDTVVSGLGTIGGMPVSIAVMDFKFLGASMGCVTGEKITRSIERALEAKIPVIIVAASGGARMYEGILSLMQMAKTSAALARLSKRGVPYISILTNPTMAGVMASFASLGDLIMAEPGALIGFAGSRVIKETTQQDLPEGFQSAEFLLEHGLIDQIVHRKELRGRLASFLELLYPAGKSMSLQATGTED